MDEKAKDDVYSRLAKLYMLEVAAQEAKKERMPDAIAFWISHMTMTAVASSKIGHQAHFAALTRVSTVRTFVSIPSFYHSYSAFRYADSLSLGDGFILLPAEVTINQQLNVWTRMNVQVPRAL